LTTVCTSVAFTEQRTQLGDGRVDGVGSRTDPRQDASQLVAAADVTRRRGELSQQRAGHRRQVR